MQITLFVVKMPRIPEITLQSRPSNPSDISPEVVAVAGLNGRSIAGNDFADASQMVAGIEVIAHTFAKTKPVVIAQHGVGGAVALLDDLAVNPEIGLVALLNPAHPLDDSNPAVQPVVLEFGLVPAFDDVGEPVFGIPTEFPERGSARVPFETEVCVQVVLVDFGDGDVQIVVKIGGGFRERVSGLL